MLGPIDIEDWSDPAADLRARVRLRPEFVELKTHPDLTALQSLSEQEFGLLSRFCADEILSDREIGRLIVALHA